METATVTEDRLNPFVLARMADVATPDAPDSPGGDWLDTVYVSALEIIEDYEDDDERRDAIAERAGSVVPVYTHLRWEVFVDLAAYNEDPTELGADPSDMNQCAGVCLYLIAERLMAAVIEDAEDADDE